MTGVKVPRGKDDNVIGRNIKVSHGSQFGAGQRWAKPRKLTADGRNYLRDRVESWKRKDSIVATFGAGPRWVNPRRLAAEGRNYVRESELWGDVKKREYRRRSDDGTVG